MLVVFANRFPSGDLRRITPEHRLGGREHVDGLLVKAELHLIVVGSTGNHHAARRVGFNFRAGCELAFLPDDLCLELDSLGTNGDQKRFDVASAGRAAVAGRTAAILDVSAPSRHCVRAFRLLRVAERVAGGENHILVDVLHTFGAAAHGNPAVMAQWVRQFRLVSGKHENGLLGWHGLTFPRDFNADGVGGDGGLGDEPAVLAVGTPADPGAVRCLDRVTMGQEIARFLILDEGPSTGEHVSRLDEHIGRRMLCRERGFLENLTFDLDCHNDG